MTPVVFYAPGVPLDDDGHVVVPLIAEEMAPQSLPNMKMITMLGPNGNLQKAAVPASDYPLYRFTVTAEKEPP